MRDAAIVTVGSELVEGLRLDTNTPEIARALVGAGLDILEAVSVADEQRLIADTLRRLTERCDVVVTTGGLGPTHDDVTREAAAEALGVALERHPGLQMRLRPKACQHTEADAADQVLRQADILPGSTIIDPKTGTAPGLIVPTARGFLALLPGPPSEMRPMLEELISRLPTRRPAPIEMGVSGMSESDAQVRALRALTGHRGVGLTVLARPGDVRIVLRAHDDDADLDAAAQAVCAELGDAVYTRDGDSLAAVVIRAARDAGLRIACAESCTGGLLAAALIAVPGASDVFLGSAVTYANSAKEMVLDVPPDTLLRYGAVSEQTARAMAFGALDKFGADFAVAVTGIAGPGGGTPEKPVGLVFFAIAGGDEASTTHRTFPSGGRTAVRERAVAFALDLLRRRIARIRP